ncbi:MAG: EamA family transporter [Proteobacteria bacterium]|nr:EamA family transporter [Pseudomonadota bacterium]
MLYLKLVLTAVFWGGTFVAGRVLSQEVPPFSAALLRFLTASGLLVPFLCLARGGLPRLTRRQAAAVSLLGLTGVFAYNAFFFAGLKTVPASRASLIIANNPVFIALFSSLAFRERLRASQVAGIALSVCGALVVIARGDPAALLSGGVHRGDLYILGCVASWVAYSLIGKIALTDLPPLVAVTYACLIGAVFLAVPAGLEGVHHLALQLSPAAWVCILYLGGLGTALGFIWYYQGIRAVGPSRAGVFINFVPVSGVLLAYLLLGETLDGSLWAGAALVIGGTWLTNRARGVHPPGVRPTVPASPSTRG